MKHEKELLEGVLHREMDRASALQAELFQAQQAKVLKCPVRHRAIPALSRCHAYGNEILPQL